MQSRPDTNSIKTDDLAVEREPLLTVVLAILALVCAPLFFLLYFTLIALLLFVAEIVIFWAAWLITTLTFQGLFWPIAVATSIPVCCAFYILRASDKREALSILMIVPLLFIPAIYSVSLASFNWGNAYSGDNFVFLFYHFAYVACGASIPVGFMGIITGWLTESRSDEGQKQDTTFETPAENETTRSQLEESIRSVVLSIPLLILVVAFGISGFLFEGFAGMLGGAIAGIVLGGLVGIPLSIMLEIGRWTAVGQADFRATSFGIILLIVFCNPFVLHELHFILNASTAEFVRGASTDLAIAMEHTDDYSLPRGAVRDNYPRLSIWFLRALNVAPLRWCLAEDTRVSVDLTLDLADILDRKNPRRLNVSEEHELAKAVAVAGLSFSDIALREAFRQNGRFAYGQRKYYENRSWAISRIESREEIYFGR